MSKVLEKVVAEQLINYLESNNLLDINLFLEPSIPPNICYFLEKARHSLNQGRDHGSSIH